MTEPLPPYRPMGATSPQPLFADSSTLSRNSGDLGYIERVSAIFNRWQEGKVTWRRRLSAPFMGIGALVAAYRSKTPLEKGREEVISALAFRVLGGTVRVAVGAAVPSYKKRIETYFQTYKAALTNPSVKFWQLDALFEGIIKDLSLERHLTPAEKIALASEIFSLIKTEFMREIPDSSLEGQAYQIAQVQMARLMAATSRYIIRALQCCNTALRPEHLGDGFSRVPPSGRSLDVTTALKELEGLKAELMGLSSFFTRFQLDIRSFTDWESQARELAGKQKIKSVESWINELRGESLNDSLYLDAYFPEGCPKELATISVIEDSAEFRELAKQWPRIVKPEGEGNWKILAPELWRAMRKAKYERDLVISRIEVLEKNLRELKEKNPQSQTKQADLRAKIKDLGNWLDDSWRKGMKSLQALQSRLIKRLENTASS